MDACDPHIITTQAAATGTPEEASAATLRAAACRPLAADPPLRRRIVELQRESEIVVDDLTVDEVVSTGFDIRRATEVTERFRSFLATEQDHLAALSILYNRPHAARRLTYDMLEELRAPCPPPLGTA